MALPALALAEPDIRETPAFDALPVPEAPRAEVLGVAEISVTPQVVAVEIGGVAHKLEGLIAAPRQAAPGDGRPGIVISHGNPRDPSGQRSVRLYRYGWLAAEFARRGYVALAVARRGFGASTGEYDEWYGTCAGATAEGYRRGGLRGAEDLAAALQSLAADPRVDPTRLLAMVQSGGGFASLALAADPPPGLVGVINFSGGRGSDADYSNCNAEGLTGAFASFGTEAAAPSLWLYSTEDRFFWPTLVNRHFDAFRGPARLVMLGPIRHAEDGHRLFQRGNTGMWRGPIDRFLARLGLPHWAPSPPPPRDLALAPPPGLDRRGKAAWREFLGSERHRAFLTGPSDAWGWGSGYPSLEAAIAAGRRVCEARGQPCQIQRQDGWN
ncbi:MAG: hypothetical protein AAGI70_04125 [Pseudomonadota bacterium]